MDTNGPSGDSLRVLNGEIVGCRRCPRLVAHREAVAQTPPRRFRGERYAARPLTGFGDPRARLLLVGLAPAAHGGNRTGRIFTGDRSGDWLFRALWEAGFASQAESVRADDGLRLRDAYVTAAVRCAPPGNKPATGEMRGCEPYLLRELELLRRVRVVIALGRIAWQAYLRARRLLGRPLPGRAPAFAHGAVVRFASDTPSEISPGKESASASCATANATTTARAAGVERMCSRSLWCMCERSAARPIPSS